MHDPTVRMCICPTGVKHGLAISTPNSAEFLVEKAILRTNHYQIGGGFQAETLVEEIDRSASSALGRYLQGLSTCKTAPNET